LTSFVLAEGEGKSAGSYWGMLLISLVFVITSFAVPVFQMLSLIVLWLAPLTLRGQKRLMVTCEILTAWQYLEVYMIAVVVALMQLGSLASTLSGGYCNQLVAVFRTLLDLGIISSQHVGCFDLTTKIEPSVYLLLVAALLLNLVTQFVMNVTRSAIEDREMRQRGYNTVPHVTWLPFLLSPAGCCTINVAKDKQPSADVNTDVKPGAAAGCEEEDASEVAPEGVDIIDKATPPPVEEEAMPDIVQELDSKPSEKRNLAPPNPPEKIRTTAV